MSLFEIRPGVEGPSSPKSVMPEEAVLHAYFSTLSSEYIKLIKDFALDKLDMPEKYSIRDVQVIMVAYEAQGPVTSSQVFKSTGLDPATVTRSVKKLVSDGYFNIRNNEQDSRSRFLDLTKKGHTLATTYKEACVELFKGQSLSIPGPTEREFRDLRDQLKKLRHRVKILRLKNF